MDSKRPRATWFTVVKGRFQRVGIGPPPPADRCIQLGGRTVVPGFVDAHTHFFQTGIDCLFVDLAGACTLEEVAERLRAGSRGRRSWTFAHSFEEDRLVDVPALTRWHLDAMFPQRPIWVNRVDYHSAVVNSLGLRRLEVPSNASGLVMQGGEPNGVLRSEAYFHAKARITRLYPIDVRERAVKAATDLFLSRGVTAVHALEGGRVFGDEGVPTLLKRMDSLPLDVTMFLQERNVFMGLRMGFKHLGGCILVDGSIGSYTAALDQDYPAHPGYRGVLYEKSRPLAAFIAEAHAAGVQLAFHAIGPRAIERVLDGYERALDRWPRFDHRHRIEHFELATDAQIDRARGLGLFVSMQPAFEYFWGGPDGMYAARLGEGWRRTNRLRTILDAGLTIAGGSDANVTPPDPLLALHAAVNHPNSAERIGVDEALRIMTIDAARAAFAEGRHGSIEPGKDANFAVLDDDPMSVAPDTLKDIGVRETWFRGRCAHRRDEPV